MSELRAATRDRAGADRDDSDGEPGTDGEDDAEFGVFRSGVAGVDEGAVDVGDGGTSRLSGRASGAPAHSVAGVRTDGDDDGDGDEIGHVGPAPTTDQTLLLRGTAPARALAYVSPWRRALRAIVTVLVYAGVTALFVLLLREIFPVAHPATDSGGGKSGDTTQRATPSPSLTANSSTSAHGDANATAARRVLLISLDGFRWDYIGRRRAARAGARHIQLRARMRASADDNGNDGEDEDVERDDEKGDDDDDDDDDDDSRGYLAPNLRRLARRGLRAKYMQPIFPTKTFPSHRSLVTGLYAESHAIVGNRFYDPVLNETFDMGHREAKWWRGEPIWATLRKQNFATAVAFWPGSDVQYGDKSMRPHAYLTPFNASMPYEERVAQVVRWLSDGVAIERGPADRDDSGTGGSGTRGRARNNEHDNDRDDDDGGGSDGDADHVATDADDGRHGRRAVPDLVAAYFEETDHQGHRHGPDSEQVNAAIQRVDAIVGDLVRRARAAVGHELNVVVVSDHGMAQVSEARAVSLRRTHFRDDMRDITLSPVAMLWPTDDNGNLVAARSEHGDANGGGGGGGSSSSGNDASASTARDVYATLRDAHLRHVRAFLKRDLYDRWHLRDNRRVSPVVLVADDAWRMTYGANEPDRDDAGRRGTWGNHGFDNRAPDMRAVFIASGGAFHNDGRVVDAIRAVDVYETLCAVVGAEPAPNNGSRRVARSMLKRRRR